MPSSKSGMMRRPLCRVLVMILTILTILVMCLSPDLFSYAESEEAGELYTVEIPEEEGEGYIVRIKDDRTASEEADLKAAVMHEDGLNELQYAENVLTAEDAAAVQEVDAGMIEYIEVNHPVILSSVNESSVSYNDPFYEGQYYLNRMNVPVNSLTNDQMLEITGGANPPVIAVIDSGLYAEHEDIDRERIVPGKCFGKNEVSDNTGDSLGHGTQVTGLLMATCDNGLGIAGLTQGIRIMPLRVVDEDGSCTERQVIEAIHYAVEQKRAYEEDPSQGANVQVINMSLEVVMGNGESSPRALQEACDEAMDAGILVVCAGGNGGGSAATYPAQYTLGVGATGYDESAGDIPAAESRLLSEDNGEGYENKIWVCAPGVDIIAPSCGGFDDYTNGTGTSFAAPQVTALAAYCKWIDPSLDQESFKTILKDTARRLDSPGGTIRGQDVAYGYGIVDYQQALQAMGIAMQPIGQEDSGTTTRNDVSPETEDIAEQEVPAVKDAGDGPLDDPENPANNNTEDKKTPEGVKDPAGAEDSAYLQGGTYSFGIDVSYWDGESIDWTKVRNAGVRFVFVRVGYASLGSGKLNEDYMYASNIEGAFHAGINVGVYFYSQATTPAEAKREADFMIKKIEPYRNYITLPLVMDMESPETYNGSVTYWAKASVSKAQVAANYLAFADTVDKADYVPMFYTYTNWITENIGSSMALISNSGYPVWLAEYPSTVGEQPPLFAKLYSALYKYEFWQYSSTGKINGISTNVDCNRWYTTDLFKYDRRGRWEKDANGWRYFNYKEELVTNGWAYDRKGCVWLNADGYWDERTGWVDDHGERYYIKGGYRQSDTWINDGSGWCYVGNDGRLLRNTWVKDSRGWCRLDAAGRWDRGTKWILVNDEWYYIRSGYRQDNTWLRDSIGWCYAGSDGRLVKNGWAKDGRGWCWLNQKGYWTKRKWIKDKGEWYYLKANGYMASNEWAKDSHGWMWMADSGRITKSKWIKYKGYWYYLKSNGYMATGTVKIGSKTYKFDSSGKWIR